MRIYKYITTAIFIILSIGCYSADLLYPVADIPESLKQNAHTVYRVFEETIEVKSEKDATETIHIVVTVLNKNGESNSYFRVLTNALTSMRGFKGKLYNSEGKQLKSFSGEDVVDRSYIDGGTTFSDNRMQFVDPKCQTYPFTVEYTYTLSHKQIFSLPSWLLYNHGESYQNASCIMKVQMGNNLNYKEYNVPAKCVRSTEKGLDVYSWTINNVQAVSPESYASYLQPDYPMIRFVSESFKLKGVSGSVKTWSEFGKWLSGMMTGKNVLPEVTVAKLRELVKDCTSDYEKIRTLYEYMQKKTRYVSVQIGLGGIEPYDATVVDNTSYGDCKALSNYMTSLLSAVGINSYYTLIRSGSNDNLIDDSFPSNQFDHVVVCVPLSKDTVWLECTNTHFPAGFLGDFTDDRYGLIINGAESKLVRTKSYAASENCIERKYSVTFDDLESGHATINSLYKGLAYEQIIPVYYAENDIIKQKMVEKSISLPSFSLLDLSYAEKKDVIPSFEETIQLNFRNYIRKVTGDVYLLPLNFMDKNVDVPERVRQRKSDVYVRRPEKDVMEVEFILPQGFKIQGDLVPVVLNTKYGRYSQEIAHKDNKLVFKRSYELYKGVYPASEYADFRDFAQQVVAADKAMVQLTKL